MNILSSEQMRKVDQLTQLNEPISSYDLMERAAQALASEITQQMGQEVPFHIICGKGNNGGDGLALARILFNNGYRVEVSYFSTEKGSPDNKRNFQALPEGIQKHKVVNQLPDFSSEVVVVDAIFGNGINKALQGVYETVVIDLSLRNNFVIALDVPSGLFTEPINGPKGAIIKADWTIGIQYPKLAFFLEDCYAYVGEWSMVDIGVPSKWIEETSGRFAYLDQEEAIRMLPLRSKYAHKGTLGRALLVAGAEGKMGAAILAAQACLFSGVGLLTVHVPSRGTTIIQTAVPEAMVSIDAQDSFLSAVTIDPKISAVAVGPGIGTAGATEKAIKDLLMESPSPMVLDADAINIIASNPSMLSLVPKLSIITPHLLELERLVGTWGSSLEMLEKGQAFCDKWEVLLVIKGPHTAIIAPHNRIRFNTTGNPGMATGGSGDVLTGVILAFLAQGLRPLEAATLGVYLHGLAADVYVQEMEEISLTASQLVQALPKALKILS